MNYQKSKNASLTVEAALVLPIFLYTVITFLYFIQILLTYERIQYGITEVAKYYSRYAYVYENMDSNTKEDAKDENEDPKTDDFSESNRTITYGVDEELPTPSSNQDNHDLNDSNNSQLIIIDNVLYKQKLKTYLNETNFSFSSIEDGYDGISFYYSSFLTDQNMVDVVVKYKIKFPNIIFHIKSFHIIQRARVHGWVGYAREDGKEAKSDADEGIVYVTETGTVYHESKSCTHLKLSIKGVKYSEVKDLRNKNGGKYKECELCNSNSLNDDLIVYITNTGDRYHVHAGCSGLKRTILEIPLSEVGPRTPCKRCYTQ